MIDSMFQEGTDQALNDQQARPNLRAPRVGFWSNFGTSAPRGVGSAVAEGIAFGAEISGAFGQVLGAYPELAGGPLSEQQKREGEAARERLTKPGGGIDYSNEVGDTFRARAREIMPDPATTGTAGQLTAGLTNFVTKAVGYGITLGPLGPVALGGDVGMTESDKLKAEGVDLPTRTAAGTVAGGIAAASVVAPLTGPTAAYRFGVGTAVGVGSMSGTALAEREILRAGGYDKLADTYDPLDPVMLAMGVVPGFLGAALGRARIAKPLRTEADVTAALKLAPDEQARENAYEASATNLRSLEAAIKAEKRADVRAELLAELEKQRANAGRMGVEAAVQAEPDLVPAARVMQTADALDAARLTPDTDLPGRDAHVSAVEMAADQMGRGEAVEVGHLLPALDEERMQRAVDTMRGPLEPVLRADDPHLTRLEAGAREVLGDRYARAARDKPAFDATLQRIAEESGGRAKLAALKGTERSVDKVLVDYGGDASRIKDILRGTIEVRDIQQARQVIDALHQRFNVQEKGKRNLLDPSAQPADGYRDAKFNVDLGGHTAEIQVNLPAMLAAKKEVHALYALREKLTREAKDRGDLTLPQEVTALNAKMRAVYDAAWAKALDTSARNVDSSIGLPLRRAEEGSKGRGAGGSQQMHSEGGTPAPSDTGIPSTSKNSTPSGNLAGRDAGFMLTSEQSVTASFVPKAADEVARVDPDMLVQLDGMDAPMRVGDLLAKVQEEARQDTLSGKLLEVAAACDLRA